VKHTERVSDLDGVDLADLRIDGDRIIGVEIERADITGAAVTNADLAGVVLTTCSIRKSSVVRTRIRDCLWPGGILQDVTFDECPAGGLSLRFSTLQRVTFADCQLSGADFYGVTFDRVRFERCDVSRAAFDTATVKSLSFTQCEFAGVTGALNLRGAEIDFEDLPTLAPSLARENGIVVRARD
jgi:uncharacterized protein YjbI with pentapeptide repeats